MQLEERDSELFKTWLVKKLESVSEVESDVLADYVVALLKSEGGQVITKQFCIQSLKDFLADHTTSVVEDIFQVLKTKGFDPARAKSRSQLKTSQPGPGQSKKRKYELDPTQPDQTRKSRQRGNRQSDRQQNVRNGARAVMGRKSGQQLLNMQMSNHFPELDPHDPLAAIIEMHRSLGLPMPPVEPLPWNTSIPNGTHRCEDYDTKGFCVRGANCPYSHGEGAFVVPQNGDGDRVLIAGGFEKRRHQGRNRGKRSSTTIVLSKIPESHLDLDGVRDFFVVFGDLDDVSLDVHHRRAVIKYTDPTSARAALASPLPIFNNRFVQLHPHYERDGTDTNDHHAEDEKMQDQEEINIEELTARQEEAQRRHEERRRQWEEAANRRLEISNKLEEINRERRRLMEDLASKTGADLGDEQETEQAIALRAQLAKLEAEAIRIGIDPNTTNTNGTYSYTPAQARGKSQARAYTGLPNSLDNRPKAVGIEFEDGNFDTHEEAIRQHLLFNGAESSLLKAHPSIEGAALIEFPQRWHAEAWMDAAHTGQIPGVGKMVLSWYKPGDTASKMNGNREENGSRMVIGEESDVEQPVMKDLDTYDEEDDT